MLSVFMRFPCGTCIRFAKEDVLPLVGRRTGASIISFDILPCRSNMLSAFMRFPCGACTRFAKEIIRLLVAW